MYDYIEKLKLVKFKNKEIKTLKNSNGGDSPTKICFATLFIIVKIFVKTVMVFQFPRMMKSQI